MNMTTPGYHADMKKSINKSSPPQQVSFTGEDTSGFFQVTVPPRTRPSSTMQPRTDGTGQSVSPVRHWQAEIVAAAAAAAEGRRIGLPLRRELAATRSKPPRNFKPQIAGTHSQRETGYVDVEPGLLSLHRDSGQEMVSQYQEQAGNSGSAEKLEGDAKLLAFMSAFKEHSQQRRSEHSTNLARLHENLQGSTEQLHHAARILGNETHQHHNDASPDHQYSVQSQHDATTKTYRSESRGTDLTSNETKLTNKFERGISAKTKKETMNKKSPFMARKREPAFYHKQPCNPVTRSMTSKQHLVRSHDDSEKHMFSDLSPVKNVRVEMLNSAASSPQYPSIDNNEVSPSLVGKEIQTELDSEEPKNAWKHVKEPCETQNGRSTNLMTNKLSNASPRLGRMKTLSTEMRAQATREKIEKQMFDNKIKADKIESAKNPRKRWNPTGYTRNTSPTRVQTIKESVRSITNKRSVEKHNIRPRSVPIPKLTHKANVYRRSVTTSPTKMRKSSMIPVRVRSPRQPVISSKPKPEKIEKTVELAETSPVKRAQERLRLYYEQHKDETPQVKTPISPIKRKRSKPQKLIRRATGATRFNSGDSKKTELPIPQWRHATASSKLKVVTLSTDENLDTRPRQKLNPQYDKLTMLPTQSVDQHSVSDKSLERRAHNKVRSVHVQANDEPAKVILPSKRTGIIGVGVPKSTTYENLHKHRETWTKDVHSECTSASDITEFDQIFHDEILALWRKIKRLKCTSNGPSAPTSDISGGSKIITDSEATVNDAKRLDKDGRIARNRRLRPPKEQKAQKNKKDHGSDKKEYEELITNVEPPVLVSSAQSIDSSPAAKNSPTSPQSDSVSSEAAVVEKQINDLYDAQYKLGMKVFRLKNDIDSVNISSAPKPLKQGKQLFCMKSTITYVLLVGFIALQFGIQFVLVNNT